jgi:hypothetical protein
VHEGLGTSDKAVALASHLGINAVRRQISTRFFWHSIVQDITKYVNECNLCQKTSNRNLKVTPALKPVTVEPQVMKQVGVDLIQLPESNGFIYVIVLIDYFSKWTEAEPLKDKTAVSVAGFLYKVICRHGCFEIQINDQGREFVNSVSTALHDMTGTQQRVTSAYHPQANGLVERQNQTIKKSIMKVLNENVEKWTSVLDGILFALRVKVHDSMGYSPFFLMYNRQPCLPIDVKYMDGLKTEDSDPVYDKEVLQNALEMRQRIEEGAISNIVSSQKKQKRDYDRKHATAIQYSVGQKVLLRNLRRDDRKGAKMTFSWLGPYEILDIFPNGTCLLKKIDCQITLKKKYSLHHLKPFKETNQKKEESSLDCNEKGENQHYLKPLKQPSKDIRKRIAESHGLPIFAIPLLHDGNENEIPSKLHTCKGDGNCFFRAIAFLLTGKKINAL